MRGGRSRSGSWRDLASAGRDLRATGRKLSWESRQAAELELISDGARGFYDHDDRHGE